MTFFDKLFRSDARAPEWARFFEDEEYARFMSQVEAELRRRGLPFELGNGVVKVKLPGQEPHNLGLQNLAQLCHREPDESWPGLIEEHFENILASHREGAELEALEAKLEGVESLLKVRIFGAGYTAETLEKMVFKPLAPNVVAALVYDLPSSVRSVEREKTLPWRRSDDDLFALAMKNVAAEAGPTRNQIDVGGGVKIEALVGQSFFTASNLLRLESFLEAPSPNGVLVAIPHRHCLLFHAIRDAQVVPALHAIIPMAFGMFQEGPGSISPALYWWREGALTELPSEMTPSRMTFSPPEPFVEMLNGLMAGVPRGPMN